MGSVAVARGFTCFGEAPRVAVLGAIVTDFCGNIPRGGLYHTIAAHRLASEKAGAIFAALTTVGAGGVVIAL